MSKMSNLDLVLDEMITAGQKMIDAATALKEMFSEIAPEMSKVETKTKKKEAPAQEAEVKALLTKYGASRLSDVKEEDYPALVAEAEVIANG